MKIAFSKEVKVALLTIVSGSLLYVGFNFLKGRDVFSDVDRYHVYYANVDGMTLGSPVLFNGMSVGQVKEMSLDEKHGNMINVMIQMEGHVPLTDSTVAKLVDGSLLGGKSIELIVKPGTRYLAEGETIPSFVEPSFTEALSESAKPVMQKIDKTLQNVNEILNEQNQKKIGQILSNLEAASLEVKEIMKVNKATLAATTSNLSKLTTSLVETEKQLKPILRDLDSFADSLKSAKIKSTVEEANKAVTQLNQVLVKVNTKQGTLGKLVNDDSLYVHIDKTVKDLDNVFIDLKARPGRYIHFSVFGKKNK